ncbi:antitoxin [Tsukamurella spumae]|uniref:Antitoxin n=1 Tax=Tsukamurella spumae TaxID=44753 RepID=A0A846X2H3_9ACTN|nr:antitoxin [Tsukamurella spumae]NKY19817.1 antitoxin [Tsukamurella spumae]
MSAKHRKASKLAAKRTAVAATAVGATAAVGLMGAPAQAAAPNYTQVISDYSHALDNFLNAANNASNAGGSVWNPVAGGTGGLLPVFGSDYSKVDITKISSLPQVLKNVGGLTLPTTIPGVVPNISVPGSGPIALPLPTTIPGGNVLTTVGTNLGNILSSDLVKPFVNVLDSASLSSLIVGLEATQTKYTSGYNWGLLGVNGQTQFLNTFLKTPSGITLNLGSIVGLDPGGIGGILGGITGVDLTKIPLLPNGTLPSGTIWVPQGNGTYNFPLQTKLGWWGAMPTGAVTIPKWLTGTDDITTVIAVPIFGSGVQLPMKVASFGSLGGNVLLPTANGVYSPIGATLSNVNTALGFGLTNLNVTTGNYVGTNGINLNNGQNLLVMQNPLGVPIPLLYGLGGFNFGVEGAGLTSPSLFGIKLFSDNLLQVGQKTGPNTSAGLIPSTLLPTDPLGQITTGVLAPFGVDSLTHLLGIDKVITPVMTAFGPVYQVFSTIALKPISDLATQQYGPMVNNTASSILDLSQRAVDQSKNLPGADKQQPVPAAQQASAPASSPLALRSTPTPAAAPATPEATSDAIPTVGENNDPSPAPAGTNAGAADTSGGKHRTGTPVKDIADKITGGLDKAGDKITGGLDKASDKITGGLDKASDKITSGGGTDVTEKVTPETEKPDTTPSDDDKPTTSDEK